MKGFFIFFLLFCSLNIRGQYPSYFHYTSEDGLPTNEIYSILQDQKGFIWIGCDVGLFKFDGINYTNYKATSQKSKSLTGLTSSSSGRIYSFSFKGQLFYVENDSVIELKHTFGKISSIICDNSSNLWVTHHNGIAVYNEINKKWTTYTDFNGNKNKEFLYTNSVMVNKSNEVWFLSNDAICKFKNELLNHYPFQFTDKKLSSGNFILENKKTGVWIFNTTNAIVYKLVENEFQPIKSNKLRQALINRKITRVIELEDNSLWICTYNGIVIYKPAIDEVTILYPNFSFSDCIVDREHNYWLTTLQNGIIRIPNLTYKVWNSENNGLSHDMVSKLIAHNNTIYLATVDGYIGVLNTQNNDIKTFEASVKGDIQQLYFDSLTQHLFYSINNDLYQISEENTKKVNSNIPPLKYLLKVNDNYILATSFGTYHIKNITDKLVLDTLTVDWSRMLTFDKNDQKLWITTNNGLLKYAFENQQWKLKKTFLNQVQILSTTIDKSTSTKFVVNFQGKLFSIDAKDKIQEIAELPSAVLANKITYHHQKIYAATNHGLWVFDLERKTWNTLNKLSGLASDNLQEIVVHQKSIWLATGNGLQKIPIDFDTKQTIGKVYLKKLFINGNSEVPLADNLQLNYNQSLGFHLEGCHFLSNGKYQFAYRIKTIDTNWISYPGNIEKIELLNLPTGPFELEIKLIDYFGNDSENTIVLNGFVNPPFWQKWWFYLIISVVVFLASYIGFQYRIKLLKNKQNKQIEHINLKNELRLTQQAALKSQMNPHFLFNVLNSIKGFIYENDKKNASLYLSNFSDLVRKVLEMSSLQYVSLEEELEVLTLYIKLESMLLEQDFSFSIAVDEKMNSSAINIPALIIQPYVENAFKHGLRHKNGEKHLQINITLENDTLLKIEIIDNGVGRKNSNKINEQTFAKPQSFATSANEKRIALLNHEKKNFVGVEVIDLLENNQAKGTKIILRITI